MSGKAWREAEELQRTRSWSAAGVAWMDIAERAMEKGDLARAQEAGSRAGDAWRREDRPPLAARALKLAWDAGRRGCIDAALLAGVLLDAGQADVALDIVAPAGDTLNLGTPDARAVLLDVRLGLHLALGSVEAAREDLAALEVLAVPGGEISRVFRQAQLDRLDGLMERADLGFKAAVTALGGIAGPPGIAAGPMAAAMAERGELALLCAALGHGSAAEARVHLEGALAGWRTAARAGPAMRAQAWLLRAQAICGEPVLAAPILDWAAGADERGLPLLAADLRVCYAVASGDASGLHEVAATLERAPLGQGRVRVIHAELGGGREADLDSALNALAADSPWFARGLRVLGTRENDAGMLAEAEARIAMFFAEDFTA